MGKREEHNYHVDQWEAKRRRRKKGSSCMQRFSRNPKKQVWQLAVPSWEKQFCLKVGLFTWEDFLDAKKYSQYYGSSKILDWDDSAAEKAFNHAKNRFLAGFRGSQPHPDDDQYLMDPDLYIDEIKWNGDEQVDPDLLEELESARLPNDHDHVEYPEDPHPIRIQDIKPTGWDIDVEQTSQSKILTGLIVGS